MTRSPGRSARKVELERPELILHRLEATPLAWTCRCWARRPTVRPHARSCSRSRSSGSSAADPGAEMPSLWPRILRSFRPPWRIVRCKGGGMWIESKDGRVLLYVYPRLNQNTDYKRPTRMRRSTSCAQSPGCRSDGTGRIRPIGCRRRSGRGAGPGNKGPRSGSPSGRGAPWARRSPSTGSR